MTNRFSSLIVVLEKDIREDDAQMLMDAIRLLHGVASVDGHISNTADAVSEHVARRRLGIDVANQLGVIIQNLLK